MVHTFELSKRISRDTFNEVIHSLNIKYYRNRKSWFTAAYTDNGFSAIRLSKFKRKEAKIKEQEDSDLTHYYMIYLSINTANMHDSYSDPHLPQSILSFSPAYVRAIYRNIFELIPCLEVHREWCLDACWREVKDCNVITDENWLNKKEDLDRKWFESNVFKASRIDFAFDLGLMNQQYLTLIDRGYSLRKGSYKRNYYPQNKFDILEKDETLSDEEPDVPDIEEFLKEIPTDESDVSNSKANINTYSSDLS